MRGPETGQAVAARGPEMGQAVQYMDQRRVRRYSTWTETGQVVQYMNRRRVRRYSTWTGDGSGGTVHGPEMGQAEQYSSLAKTLECWNRKFYLLIFAENYKIFADKVFFTT